MSDIQRTISRRVFLGTGVLGATAATGFVGAVDNVATFKKPRGETESPLLNGLIIAVFTPFHPDGNINLDIVPEYAETLIASGMNGFYVTGSTGEGISLSVGERKSVAEAFVKAAKGRVPVTVQVGANSLQDCRELAAHAEAIGAGAISANAPSYFTINETTILVDFLSSIAVSAPKTPFYYYHIPVRAGVSVADMSLFLSLAEKHIPTFAGVKYTDHATGPYQEILRYGNGKYEALWGTDEMLLCGLATGAKGGIGATYSLAPGVYRNIFEAFQQGDMEKARFWQYRSWEWVKVLFQTKHLLAACRSIHRKDGLDLGQCRLPLAPFNGEAEKKLFHDLETLGYYDWRNG